MYSKKSYYPKKILFIVDCKDLIVNYEMLEKKFIIHICFYL